MAAAEAVDAVAAVAVCFPVWLTSSLGCCIAMRSRSLQVERQSGTISLMPW